jgi:hypothetical protein
MEVPAKAEQKKARQTTGEQHKQTQGTAEEKTHNGGAGCRGRVTAVMMVAIMVVMVMMVLLM